MQTPVPSANPRHARHLALVLFCALRGSSATAQPQHPPDARVVAELLDAAHAMAGCGIMHFLVPMRYRVVSVEAGALRASQVLDVVVSCPELWHVHFVAGAHHRLGLASRRPWSTGSLVPWPGHPAPARRWWAVSVADAP